MTKKKINSQDNLDVKSNDISFLSKTFEKLIEIIPEIKTHQQLIAFIVGATLIAIVVCAIFGHIVPMIILCSAIILAIVSAVVIYAFRSSNNLPVEDEKAETYKEKPEAIVSEVSVAEFKRTINGIHQMIGISLLLL